MWRNLYLTPDQREIERTEAVWRNAQRQAEMEWDEAYRENLLAYEYAEYRKRIDKLLGKQSDEDYALAKALQNERRRVEIYFRDNTLILPDDSDHDRRSR